MSCDIFLVSILFTYFFYVIGVFQKQTYTRFRYEFARHQVFLITVSISVLICVPLQLYQMIFWLRDLSV